MLNLADYGTSSDEDASAQKIPMPDSDDDEQDSEPSLLRNLPKPSSQVSKLQCPASECELEAEVTRKRAWLEEGLKNQIPPAKKLLGGPKKVQIFLPEFSNLDGNYSDEEDEKIGTRPNFKSQNAAGNDNSSSTLLSLLPKPTAKSLKVSKASFLPRQSIKNVSSTERLQKSPSPCPSSLRDTPKHVQQPSTLYKKIDSDNATKIPLSNRPSLLAVAYSSDSDDEEDTVDKTQDKKLSDFFGLTSKSEDKLLIEEHYVDHDPYDLTTIGPSHSHGPHMNEIPLDTTIAAHPSQIYNLAGCSTTEDYDYQDKNDLEQIKQLIYKNEIDKINDGHHYVLPDDLEVTDVRVDSHLGDVRENLLKNITSKPPDAMLLAAQMAAATSGGKGSKKAKPDPTAKRKHQITYLAHLAKEREEALQNQWAENREKRKASQSRYGFR